MLCAFCGREGAAEWRRRRAATQPVAPFNVGGIPGEINENFPAGKRMGSKLLGTLKGGVRCVAARPSKESGKSNSRLYLPQADSVSCNECSHRIHRIHTKSSCVHASHVRWVPSYDQNFVISTPVSVLGRRGWATASATMHGDEGDGGDDDDDDDDDRRPGHRLARPWAQTPGGQQRPAPGEGEGNATQ